MGKKVIILPNLISLSLRVKKIVKKKKIAY